MPFPRKSSKPQVWLSEPALHEYALQSLGRRMRSEADLRRLMRAKVEPDEAGAAKVSVVVARLKEYGYLDDTAYADNYVRLRQQNEKQGQRRVRQDLGQKGVSKEIISQTIEARYADISEETLARQHLERKRIRKPENEKETARVMRRLVTAGFSPTVIYKILRQWDVSDEALATLDNLEDDAPADE
ncbi:regulatory protein RecX [Acidicapsa ligni]|uniref:regulatory protein RecX n=1 Tax=Acidicapsa ligni TaxID=542300 RepID=UPI0021DF75B5|nr:regulatory protein RecX [Acidicapsa ligni]